jgi:hypothetical protein
MFDLDPWVLFLSIAYSCVAAGYISYGKKRDELTFLLAGILLMVISFMINTFWPLVLSGAACVIAPFIISL